jgi:multidrug efflux pump subunit AcrA (membrane-fusion protein)
MNKFLLLLLLPIFTFSKQITLEHAQMKPLGKVIQTNAQITQLSDQKQEVVSRLSGHIESYFVKTGEEVKDGDKVALIESMELSKMSAEYLALLQQAKAAKIQLNTSRKLYKKGLNSKNELNNFIIASQEISAKQNALASQLRSLGIKTSELTEATDQFILYAHADGVVGKILAPLHTNVDKQTPLVTVVNQSGYYAVAYLGVDDAMKISDKTTGWINVASQKYACHFVQLLPQIDEETQRAKVLFQIENSPKNLLLGAFTEMEISLEPYVDVLMVKKSALTLFQGEWVVFIETHHDGHEENEAKHKEESEHDHEAHKDEHREHGHDALEVEHEEHGHDALEVEHEAEDHDDHEEHGHDEHKEEKSPYTPKVVKIIAYSGNYAAIEGINTNDEYVSKGAYFVKSMMLKSSLGGHGH